MWPFHNRKIKLSFRSLITASSCMTIRYIYSGSLISSLVLRLSTKCPRKCIIFVLLCTMYVMYVLHVRDHRPHADKPTVHGHTHTFRVDIFHWIGTHRTAYCECTVYDKIKVQPFITVFRLTRIWFAGVSAVECWCTVYDVTRPRDQSAKS